MLEDLPVSMVDDEGAVPIHEGKLKDHGLPRHPQITGHILVWAAAVWWVGGADNVNKGSFLNVSQTTEINHLQLPCQFVMFWLMLKFCYKKKNGNTCRG